MFQRLYKSTNISSRYIIALHLFGEKALITKSFNMALLRPILDTFGPLKDGVQSIRPPPPS